MSDARGFLRLMAWLSPVFPTGGFSYSSGLETAVQTGLVTNEEQLTEWLTSLLRHGSVRNDSILLAEAWRSCRDTRVLHDISELALALSGSAERYLELTAQGEAFANAVRNWPETGPVNFPNPCSLPVAVGIASAYSALDLQQTLNAYLHGFVTNQLQAAIRLSVFGQTAAARILARLEPVILAASDVAAMEGVDDLGSATFMADVMAMKHEELPGRMFRS